MAHSNLAQSKERRKGGKEGERKGEKEGGRGAKSPGTLAAIAIPATFVTGKHFLPCGKQRGQVGTGWHRLAPASDRKGLCAARARPWPVALVSEDKQIHGEPSQSKLQKHGAQRTGLKTA